MAILSGVDHKNKYPYDVYKEVKYMSDYDFIRDEFPKILDVESKSKLLSRYAMTFGIKNLFDNWDTKELVKELYNGTYPNCNDDEIF